MTTLCNFTAERHTLQESSPPSQYPAQNMASIIMPGQALSQTSSDRIRIFWCRTKHTRTDEGQMNVECITEALYGLGIELNTHWSSLSWHMVPAGAKLASRNTGCTLVDGGRFAQLDQHDVVVNLPGFIFWIILSSCVATENIFFYFICNIFASPWPLSGSLTFFGG